MVRQKLEWKLDRPPALVRSSAEGPSTVVAIGTSRVRWSIVQREKKTQRSQRLIVRSLNPSSSTNKGVLSGLFSRPDACHNRFALRCYRARECTAVGRSGCSAGKAKNSSYPWHFRCWSLRRNELECTDLVHWTGALHRFFVTRCNYLCWFSVRKAFWRWFYPRSRKRDHFQTLATGVPKLKTCLGTQRVKAGPPLEAILVIFGRRALIFFLFESSWKKMKNDATFVRMRSGDHLGDAKMSKKGTSLRRI